MKKGRIIAEFLLISLLMSSCATTQPILNDNFDNEDSVIKVKMNNLTADKSTMSKITDLPSRGHWTRTIRIKDNDLYISIGSSCNACIEDDKRRAAILKCEN